MIGLSEFVFGAVIGEDIVLLDTRADRYHALVGAVHAQERDASVDGIAWSLVPAAASALVEAGLASREAGRGFSEMLPPTAVVSLAECEHAAAGPRDYVDLTVAVGSAWWRLRRGLAFRSHHAMRPPISKPIAGGLVGALDALRRTRTFLPTPRRCLPASLTTSAFLARRGVATHIVFGVRAYPFEAHCWVEHEGIVVDDDLAKVSAFQPIMVARP